MKSLFVGICIKFIKKCNRVTQNKQNLHSPVMQYFIYALEVKFKENFFRHEYKHFSGLEIQFPK